MFNFFAKLRKLFSRKKEEKPHEQIAPQEVPAETEEPVKAEEKKPQEVTRKEKICEHCGAPNDDFVRKCCLCKRDV